MTVSPRFAAADEGTEALKSSREIALDRGGRAEINVASLFRQYPRAPREVDILLSLESPAQASERIVIDGETSEALYLPVREERSAEQAEGAGNKAAALEHYGIAYAACADREREDLLWKKIATLYRSMQPKPAVPDEARRYMVRGQSAVQEATSPKDFDAAAREFETAARKAPFWPDAYYNLAVLQGKLGRYDDAIANLRKYLDLAPDADDAEQVKTMIYQFDYKKTKAGGDAAPSRPATGQNRRSR
jgi:tetratricopeptide (TPR) repeat protein